MTEASKYYSSRPVAEQSSTMREFIPGLIVRKPDGMVAAKGERSWTVGTVAAPDEGKDIYFYFADPRRARSWREIKDSVRLISREKVVAEGKLPKEGRLVKVTKQDGQVKCAQIALSAETSHKAALIALDSKSASDLDSFAVSYGSALESRQLSLSYNSGNDRISIRTREKSDRLILTEEGRDFSQKAYEAIIQDIGTEQDVANLSLKSLTYQVNRRLEQLVAQKGFSQAEKVALERSVRARLNLVEREARHFQEKGCIELGDVAQSIKELFYPHLNPVIREHMATPEYVSQMVFGLYEELLARTDSHAAAMGTLEQLAVQIKKDPALWMYYLNDKLYHLMSHGDSAQRRRATWVYRTTIRHDMSSLSGVYKLSQSGGKIAKKDRSFITVFNQALAQKPFVARDIGSLMVESDGEQIRAADPSVLRILQEQEALLVARPEDIAPEDLPEVEVMTEPGLNLLQRGGERIRKVIKRLFVRRKEAGQKERPTVLREALIACNIALLVLGVGGHFLLSRVDLGSLPFDKLGPDLQRLFASALQPVAALVENSPLADFRPTMQQAVVVGPSESAADSDSFANIPESVPRQFLPDEDISIISKTAIPDVEPKTKVPPEQKLTTERDAKQTEVSAVALQDSMWPASKERSWGYITKLVGAERPVVEAIYGYLQSQNGRIVNMSINDQIALIKGTYRALGEQFKGVPLDDKVVVSLLLRGIVPHRYSIRQTLPSGEQIERAVYVLSYPDNNELDTLEFEDLYTGLGEGGPQTGIVTAPDGTELVTYPQSSSTCWINTLTMAIEWAEAQSLIQKESSSKSSMESLRFIVEFLPGFEKDQLEKHLAAVKAEGIRPLVMIQPQVLADVLAGFTPEEHQAIIDQYRDDFIRWYGRRGENFALSSLASSTINFYIQGEGREEFDELLADRGLQVERDTFRPAISDGKVQSVIIASETVLGEQKDAAKPIETLGEVVGREVSRKTSGLNNSELMTKYLQDIDYRHPEPHSILISMTSSSYGTRHAFLLVGEKNGYAILVDGYTMLGAHAGAHTWGHYKNMVYDEEIGAYLMPVGDIAKYVPSFEVISVTGSTS